MKIFRGEFDKEFCFEWFLNTAFFIWLMYISRGDVFWFEWAVMALWIYTVVYFNPFNNPHYDNSHYWPYWKR